MGGESDFDSLDASSWNIDEYMQEEIAQIKAEIKKLLHDSIDFPLKGAGLLQ